MVDPVVDNIKNYLKYIFSPFDLSTFSFWSAIVSVSMMQNYRRLNYTNNGEKPSCKSDKQV